jgi:transposase-like protein
MATTDTTGSKTESGSDGETPRATPANGAKGTRRKLNDQQEREVTRLYAETETPVSEISKRFGIGESSVYRVAQRHGAKLRGRTATAAAATPRVPRAARATTAAAKPAAVPGPGRGRGRRAASTAAATPAAKPTAAAGRPAATPSTNGRRRGRVAATPARRTVATTARATRAPRGTRAAAVVAVTRREFRVSYTAVRVFSAASMADAIRQAEAAGATDITGIERSS